MVAALVACNGDERCDPDATGTICTIAGNGDLAYREADEGGPAVDAALYAPIDVAVSPSGDLWLIDFNNYRVRAIDRDGRIATVIGNGEVGDSPAPGQASIPAREAPFNHTTDLVFHDGYLYLAGWHNSRVKRVRLSDMTLENYAGRGRRSYYDGEGGPALDASFDLPVSLAIDPRGNVAIMDQANQVVRRVDETRIIDRIAGQCIIENEKPCAPGQAPVPCEGSNKLTCGAPASCVEQCTPAFAGDGELPTLARMAQGIGQTDPTGGIAYDHVGCLVFADTDNHRIRRIDPMGIMTTIAGTGVQGFAGEGTPAVTAALNRPFDVEIGPDDSVYFTDVYNDCVRKIDPQGSISTVAGQCGTRGFDGDGGPAELALLNRPEGIALDGDKLYIADSYNSRVRVVKLR